MAQLKFIVLHCTATPEGRKVTREDIVEWHIHQRGWKRVGYHYLIHLDGTIEVLHKHNADDQIDPWEITNGAKGHNAESIHIVYAGGCAKVRPSGMRFYPPKDTRTKAQKEALETLVKRLLNTHTKAKVCGHNQLANKACPSFDVPSWAESVEIGQKRIFR